MRGDSLGCSAAPSVSDGLAIFTPAWRRAASAARQYRAGCDASRAPAPSSPTGVVGLFMITVTGEDRTRRLSDEELRAIYGPEYVSQYDPHALVRMRRLVPFLELSSDQTVADFGCGNGVLLELIGGRVHEYVGIDFSQAFIRAAEQRRDARGLRNGTFHCSEIVSFCAQHPNRFDAGFALDFSEHVYDDQFLSMFRA